MSEFWVSRKKWTCKYCDVTINDDVPSRQQHENGLRHKGNVERHLRQAYKKTERERREESEAKREMQKIERLARESHAKDVGAAALPLPSASTSKAASPPEETAEAKGSRPPAKWKPSDRLAAYGSALPIHSAEEEERALQEWQEKQEARRKEGTAGEWETVASSSSSSSVPIRRETEADLLRKPESSYVPREKQGHFRDDEDDDDALIPEIKVKKRIKVQSEAKRLVDMEEEKRKLMPSWTSMRLEPGTETSQVNAGANVVADRQTAERGIEESEGATGEERKSTAISPADTTTSTSMFKKRKSGAGAGAKRVRAVI